MYWLMEMRRPRNLRNAASRCLIDATKTLSISQLGLFLAFFSFLADLLRVMQDSHQLLQSHLYGSQSPKKSFLRTLSKSLREDSCWPALGHVFILVNHCARGRELGCSE